MKASEKVRKRIDYLVSTLVPFKGRYVRDMQDGILVAFDSVIDAARYAEYVSPKCPAHLIAEGQRSIDFNSGVKVFLSVE